MHEGVTLDNPLLRLKNHQLGRARETHQRIEIVNLRRHAIGNHVVPQIFGHSSAFFGSGHARWNLTGDFLNVSEHFVTGKFSDDPLFKIHDHTPVVVKDSLFFPPQ